MRTIDGPDIGKQVMERITNDQIRFMRKAPEGELSQYLPKIVVPPLADSTQDQNASELSSRFDVIMLDAMDTIFVSKAGKYAVNREILSNLGIEATEERVREVYEDQREYFEAHSSAFGRERWSLIDGGIVNALASEEVRNKLVKEYGSLKEVGAWINDQFLGNPKYFAVPDHMRRFLEAVHSEGLLVVIASNHETEKLSSFVSHFGLDGLIDVTCSSEELRCEKPDPKFFFKIVDKINGIYHKAHNPGRILMIGDELENDINCATKAGITPILVDYHAKLPDAPCTRVSDLTELLDPNFFLKHTLRS
jgi:HAD superfamily hydrolase (TIGR01549 family)